MAYWTGVAGDGRWANPGNWSGGKVPNMGLGAVVNSGATIAIEDGDNTDWLQVTSPDPVALVGGTLNTPAVLSQGTVPVQFGCRLAPAGALTVNGEIQVIPGGSISVTNGGWKQSGNLTISPNASILFARSASATLSMTGHLVNNGGSITLNGGTLNITGNLVNSGGTVSIANGGIITPTGLFTAGTFYFTNGQLNCSAPWNVTGDTTLALAPGTTNRMYVGATTNVTWSGAVNITGYKVGDAANRIVIGSNKYGATAAQIGAIGYPTDSGSNPAYLNSYGWVLPDGAITITSQPSSVTTNASSQVAFSVGYFSKYPVTFQWQKNGQNISGATGPSYAIPTASSGDTGTYNVLLKSSTITDSSRAASLSVLAATIAQQPINQNVAYGSALSLSVAVTNANAPITYQWYRNGQAISGASTSTYAKSSVAAADDGDYTVTVTSPSGNVTSSPAHVTVGPVITQQPSPVSLQYGQTLTLSITAGGSQPLVYQWLQDGQQIEGATSPTFNLSGAANTNAGNYTVVVSNPAGSVSSTPTTVSVLPNDPPVVKTPGVTSGAILPVGTINATATVSDPNGYPVTISYSLDGAPQPSGNFSILTSGNHTLTVIATDSWGASTTNTTSFSTYAGVPTVTLTPATGSVTNASSITLNAIATTPNVGATISQIEIFDGSTSLGTTVPLTVSNPSGTHTYKAVATDSYGQQGTTSSTIQFVSIPAGDLIPPAVSLSGPGQGLVLSPANFVITATNYGPGSIAKVQLLVDGNIVATTSSGNNGSYNLSWTPTNTGSCTLSAVAFTAQAVGSMTAGQVFTVNPADPPTIVVNGITNGQTFASGAIINFGYVITAPSNGSTITGASVTRDGAAWVSDPVNMGSLSWAPAAGAHTLVATATNSYGATAQVKTTFTVAQALAVSITSPLNNQYLTSVGYQTIAASVSGGTTVTGVTFSVDGTNISTATRTPWQTQWLTQNGNHTIRATAADVDGETATSTISISANLTNGFDIGPLSEGGSCSPDANTIDNNDSTCDWSRYGYATTVTRTWPVAHTIYGVKMLLNDNYSAGNAEIDYSPDGTTWIVGGNVAIATGTYWYSWNPTNPISAKAMRVTFSPGGPSGSYSYFYTWNIWADPYENPVDPSGQIVSPANGSTVCSALAVPVQVVAQDDGYVANASLYLDSTLVASGVGSNNFSFYWTAASPGTHTAYASIQDNQGRIRNTPTSSFTVTTPTNVYDIGPLSEGGTCSPDASSIDNNDSTSDNARYGYPTTITRTWPVAHIVYGAKMLINDTATGNAEVDYSPDGTNWIVGGNVAIANGTYWYYWNPTNAISVKAMRVTFSTGGSSGNYMYLYTLNLWADHNENPGDPSGQIVSPANGSTVNSALAVPIQVAAQDDGYVANASVYVDNTVVASGAGSNNFSFYWTAASPGTHTVYASIQDNQGRIRITPTSSFTVAYPANVYDVSPLSEGGTCSPDGSFVDNNDTSSSAIYTSGTFSRTWPVTHTVYGAKMLIGVGWAGGSTELDYTLDGTTWVKAAAWSLAGYSQQWYYWNATTPVAMKAMRLVSYGGTSGGNVNLYTWNIWSDHNENPVDPSGVITSPAGGSAFNSPLAVPIQIAGQDDGYVANVSAYVDNNQVDSGSGSNNFSLYWIAASPGSHSAYATVQDNLGRIRYTATNAFTITYETNFYDIGPLSEGGSCSPDANSVDGNDSSETYYINGGTVTRTWPVARTIYGAKLLFRDGSSGNVELDYSPDGVNWVFATKWSTAGTTQWYYWNAKNPTSVKAMRLIGTAGGSSGTTIGFRTWTIWADNRDNAAPTLALSTPADGTSLSAGIAYKITGSITDPGTATITLQANGASIGTNSVICSGTFTNAWTPAGAGNFTVTATLTDRWGGSVQASSTVTVLSNNPPIVTVTQPADGSTISAGSGTFTATASDTEGEAITNVFYVDGKTVGSATGSSSACTVSNLALGTHQVYATATDANGSGFSATNTFTVAGQTVLLLHMDGSNGGSTFSDSSSYGHSIGITGATNSTTQAVGGTSGGFNGSNAYLGSTATGSEYAFGVGDFTIECWVYPTGAQTNHAGVITKCNTAGFAPFRLSAESSGSIWAFYATSSGTSWDLGAGASFTVGSVDTNRWTHLAITRQGNIFRAFKNGQQVSITTNALTLWNNSDPVNIGRNNDSTPEYFKGFIDEVRLVKGAAIYTANFTPSTNSLSSGTPPQVAITNLTSTSNPEPGRTTNVAVTATATATAATITNVTVFVDGIAIGSSTSAPCTVAWTPTPGSHSIAATATDSNGGTGNATLSLTSDIRTGLADNWKFDGNYSDSAGSLTLTATGSPAFGTGVSNNCVVLTGTNYMSVASGPYFGTNSFTMSIWAKSSNGTSGNSRLMGADLYSGAWTGINQAYCWLTWNGGAVNAAVQDDQGNQWSVNTMGSYNDNAWHLFTLVVDRTTGQSRIYVDGVRRGSTFSTSTGSIGTSSPKGFAIGSQYGLAGSSFNGSLDDARIYSGRALSDLEAQELYTAALTTGALTNLVLNVPGSNSTYEAGETATITATPTTDMIRMDMGVDGTTMASVSNAMASVNWTVTAGKHSVWAIGYRADGSTVTNTANATGDIQSGLADQWSFENNYVEQASGYNLTPTGNPTFNSGINGSAVQFGGADSASNSTPRNFANKSFSITLWAKSTDATAGQTRIVGDDLYNGGWNGTGAGQPYWWVNWNGGKPAIDVGDDKGTYAGVTSTLTTPVNDGAWHQIVVVVDRTANQTRIYVDGVRSGTSTTVLTGYLGTNGVGKPFYVGSQGGGNYFKGAVDEMRIYVCRALSDSDVTCLYSLRGGSQMQPQSLKQQLSSLVSTSSDTGASMTEAAAASTVSAAGTADSGYSTEDGTCTFNGLFYETNQPAWERAGALTILVDATNNFQGTLLTKGFSYPFSGQIDASGQVASTVVRSNDTTLTVSFGLTQGTLTGTIGDGNWTATLEGEAVSMAPSTQAGFNVLLNDGGLGNGTVQIGTNSVAQTQFTLLDGTTVTESCGISITGQWPVYQALYNGQGGVLGWLQLTPTNVIGTAVWWSGSATNLNITGTLQGAEGQTGGAAQ